MMLGSHIWAPLVIALLLLASPASAESVVGHVSVIDGDTIQINGKNIRLLDIDAPEGGQYCFKKLQSLNEGAWPCGLQAALALSDWIGEQLVACDLMNKEATTFQVLWLAQCDAAGQDLATWVAANGWGVPNVDCTCSAVRDAAHNARAAQLNIWTSAFTLPWDWRKAH